MEKLVCKYFIVGLILLLIQISCSSRKDDNPKEVDAIELTGIIDFNQIITRNDIIQRSDILLPYPIGGGGGFFKLGYIKYLAAPDFWLKAVATNLLTNSVTRANIALDGSFSLPLLKKTYYKIGFILKTEEGDYEIADLYSETSSVGAITTEISTFTDGESIDLGAISIDGDIAMPANNPLDESDSDKDGIFDSKDTDDDGDGIEDSEDTHGEIILPITESLTAEETTEGPQTYTINSDLIITKSSVIYEGIFNVTDGASIIVNEGARLIVANVEGTAFNFNEGSKVDSYGTFDVLGNKTNMVPFNTVFHEEWGGINVKGSGEFNCSYCAISLGPDSSGVSFADSAKGKINNSIFDSFGQPNPIIEIASTGEIKILHSTFIDGGSAQIGITSSGNTPYNVTIMDNIFHLNDGISSPDEEISGKFTITNNAFSNENSSISGFLQNLVTEYNYFNLDCNLNNFPELIGDVYIDSTSPCYTLSSEGGPIGALFE